MKSALILSAVLLVACAPLSEKERQVINDPKTVVLTGPQIELLAKQVGGLMAERDEVILRYKELLLKYQALDASKCI